MKTCTQCNEAKRDEEFAKKGKGRQSKCKECHRSYSREHYKENPRYYKDKSKSSRSRNQEYVKATKSCPCADCGIEYPYYVMDFDHVSDDKEANLADLVRVGASLVKLQAEINKCEVVCSNCHRIRTFKRLTV